MIAFERNTPSTLLQISLPCTDLEREEHLRDSVDLLSRRAMPFRTRHAHHDLIRQEHMSPLDDDFGGLAATNTPQRRLSSSQRASPRTWGILRVWPFSLQKKHFTFDVPSFALSLLFALPLFLSLPFMSLSTSIVVVLFPSAMPHCLYASTKFSLASWAGLTGVRAALSASIVVCCRMSCSC